MTDRRDDVCQERTEAGEVDRVGLWPNDLVREDPLAVVLIGIEAVSFIEGLASENRRFGRVVEKILNLRTLFFRRNRRRHGIHVFDDVNERFSASW